MADRSPTDPAAAGVDAVVQFGRGKIVLKMIGIGILLIALSAVAGYHSDKLLLASAGVALGSLVVLWQVRELVSGAPLLTLSPDGLRLNVDGYSIVDIPWHEVEEITDLDLKTRALLPNLRNSGLGYGNEPSLIEVKKAYKAVTALRISTTFHDRVIQPRRHAGSKGGILRRYLKTGMASYIGNPNDGMAVGWGSIFVLRDNKRYVALHHTMLPVDRNRLRAMVEARWFAFRGEAPAAAAG